MSNTLQRAKQHYQALAPHVKARVTATLLKELIDALESATAENAKLMEIISKAKWTAPRYY